MSLSSALCGRFDERKVKMKSMIAVHEIAVALSVPLGTALTWMHAATLRLKKELGKWNGRKIVSVSPC